MFSLDTTLCHPDQFQAPLHTHPNPFTPISSLHNHPKPLHTHLRTSVSISGHPHFSLAIYTHLRSSTPVPDLLHPPQSLYTHPRCSIFTLDFPDQFQCPSPIQAPSHPSQPIPTHLKPSLLTKAFNTHTRSSTHTPHTQTKPFTPILGPPYPSLASILLLVPLKPP